ncbi:hypothetical protein ACHAQA_010066 [Verticillium albo-atrum]
MSRLTSWFRPSPATTPTTPGSSTPNGTTGKDHAQDVEKTFRATDKMLVMEDALAAAGLMMNDDIEGAVEALSKNDSVFHLLGIGITRFMRAVLGFEKDVMAEASTTLAECETRAWNEMKTAQRKAERHSTVYAPGTEYSLVAAQSQLMSAVVSVLHESLTEALKGFYKLRKAYAALDAIVQAEDRVLGASSRAVPTLKRAPTDDQMPGSFDDDEFADVRATDNDGLRPADDSDEFVDAKETPGQSGTQTPLTGLSTVNGEKDDLKDGLKNDDLDKDMERLQVQEKSKLILEPAADAALLTNPLDIFIHSGTNMCFGLLLIILSMVPPAMSRLLSIIGFRGDRARGVRMLWSATRFRNVNGAVSGLVLLGYYNGLLGQADILPPTDLPSSALFTGTSGDGREKDVIGIPREKCAALLADMRVRYPESRMWRLEEARRLSQDRRLRDAIKVLSTGPDAKMRQVAALNAFEMGLFALFTGDWLLTRDTFLRCLELNDWSHCLYYYIAGCAELERYRDAVHGVDGSDEHEARRRKKKVEELWRKAPAVAGRKKFMAKPLPFDVFVQRKVAKMEERAKELGVDLADAAASSPAWEMASLWCGMKRMNNDELEAACDGLAWERCTAGEAGLKKMRETPDEVAVRAVTLACVLRTLGKLDEARVLLKTDALSQDRTLIKGPLMDDYALPAAHYELGVIAWLEACGPDTPGSADANADAVAKDKEHRVAKAKQSQEHLDAVVAWEAFLFDARLGMRVQTGLETLKWFRERAGVA